MAKKKPHNKSLQRVSAKAIFIWALAILFFFYEFFLRVLPATMAKNLIESLHLTLEQFAFIGSGYYLTYSLMQLPVGFLLDKFKIKSLLVFASALCTLGTLWFYFANGFGAALICRLVVGVGSAFGFVGLMVVTLSWFPKRYFAFLIGCGQFLGAVGPMCASGPIALVLRATNGNWRLIYLFVALFGIGLTVLIALFVSGQARNRGEIIVVDKKVPLNLRLKRLASTQQVWWIMLYAGLIYVSLPLLGAFWGTSYLEARAFSSSTAAFLISMIWLGMAVACPLFGRLSDMAKRRKPFVISSALIGCVSSLLLLYTPFEHPLYLGFLFFLIGFAGGGQNMSFVFMSEHAPHSLRATALGLNNTAVMGFSAILPPIITSIMQFLRGDNPLSLTIFNQVLIAIPIVFGLALLIALFALKETYCRQQGAVHTVTFSSKVK